MCSSSSLIRFLDSFIKENDPGTRLPFDRELAEAFSLSISTVKRVLKLYVQSGKLQRLQGKGTFLPAHHNGSPEPSGHVPVEEDIVKTIYNGIADGTFKKGTPLPMNKLLCLQFKVSPRTVSRAYRRIAQEGLVTKMGKRFVVGSFPSIVQGGGEKKAILFFDPVYGPEKLFNESRFSLDLRKMESELQLHGFLLSLAPLTEFSDRVHKWISSDLVPQGIIMCGHREGAVEIAALEKPYPAFAYLQSRMKQLKPNILCIGLGRPHARFKGVNIINMGHIDLVRARVMARYLLVHGHREAVFFFDESELDRRLSTHVLRLLPEIKQLVPDFNLRIVIRTDAANRNLSRENLLQRLYEKTPPRVISTHLSRYKPYPTTALTDTIHWCHSFEKEYAECVSSGFWIFGNGIFALAALQWCGRNTIAVPREVSLLAYEESPACLQHGISVCREDWETTGYLMAHALIGDIPIARSRHGYIVTQARILKRHTTR